MDEKRKDGANMKLSVIMMVQNEEKTIDLALKSVESYADEIFVFDTGSSDETTKILKQHGVNLFIDSIPKIKFGDKSWKHTAVRQFLLSRCHGDWILHLDGDEVYPKETMEEFIKKSKDKTPAYRVEWVNFIAPFKKIVTSRSPLRFWKKELNLIYDKPFPYESFNYQNFPFHSNFVGKMIEKLENPLFHFSCLKKDYWRKKANGEFYLLGGTKTEEYKNEMIDRYAKELEWSQ